jgi:hypothetical protein
MVLRDARSSPEKFDEALQETLLRLWIEVEDRDRLGESAVLYGLMKGDKKLIEQMATPVWKEARKRPDVLDTYAVAQKTDLGRLLVRECGVFLDEVTERLYGSPEGVVPTPAALAAKASSFLAEAVHAANRRVRVFSMGEAEMRRCLMGHFALQPISDKEDPERMAKRVLVALGLKRKSAENVLGASPRMKELRKQRRGTPTPASGG